MNKINILNFPVSTFINRAIPKSTFYDYINMNLKLKQQFVNNIDKIIWLYKLSPLTINIKDGTNVHDITFFEITLKNQICPNDLFTFIDKNIPRHLIFLVNYLDQSKFLINYKKRNNCQDTTFSIIKTFSTPWQRNTSIKLSIEGKNLDYAYFNFTLQISGINLNNIQNIDRAIELKAEA